MMNKFYLIKRLDKVDYDEYDSAVVVAESEEAALELLKKEHTGDHYNGWGSFDVEVTEIDITEQRIILESFNAG